MILFSVNMDQEWCFKRPTHKKCTKYQDKKIINEVFEASYGDIELCTKPEENILRCTFNIDFNEKYPENERNGFIATNKFYSWGMISEIAIPSKKMTTKWTYNRI